MTCTTHRWRSREPDCSIPGATDAVGKIDITTEFSVHFHPHMSPHNEVRDA